MILLRYRLESFQTSRTSVARSLSVRRQLTRSLPLSSSFLAAIYLCTGFVPRCPPIHYTGCTRPAHHPTESLPNGVRIGRPAVDHDIHGMSVKTGQHTVISDKIQSYYHQCDLRQNSVLLPPAFFHIETVCHAC